MGSYSWQQQRQGDWEGMENWVTGAYHDIAGTISGQPKALAASMDSKPVVPDAGAPAKPDAADEAITKARSNAWQRLQMGKTRQNSFGTQGVLGGFDVGKPVLGGY